MYSSSKNKGLEDSQGNCIHSTTKPFYKIHIIRGMFKRQEEACKKANDGYLKDEQLISVLYFSVYKIPAINTHNF
jgi:hypothetical protein